MLYHWPFSSYTRQTYILLKHIHAHKSLLVVLNFFVCLQFFATALCLQIYCIGHQSAHVDFVMWRSSTSVPHSRSRLLTANQTVLKSPHPPAFHIWSLFVQFNAAPKMALSKTAWACCFLVKGDVENLLNFCISSGGFFSSSMLQGQRLGLCHGEGISLKV